MSPFDIAMYDSYLMNISANQKANGWLCSKVELLTVIYCTTFIK